mmetsp:Transcript_6351/g.13132  ORF Transcript_6351/g.13132 Transcript_6351/m.13132 type:complete len:217 (-) Transcript_6351:1310-1960(-)
MCLKRPFRQCRYQNIPGHSPTSMRTCWSCGNHGFVRFSCPSSLMQRSRTTSRTRIAPARRIERVDTICRREEPLCNFWWMPSRKREAVPYFGRGDVPTMGWEPWWIGNSWRVETSATKSRALLSTCPSRTPSKATTSRAIPTSWQRPSFTQNSESDALRPKWPWILSCTQTPRFLNPFWILRRWEGSVNPLRAVWSGLESHPTSRNRYGNKPYARN